MIEEDEKREREEVGREREEDAISISNFLEWAVVNSDGSLKFKIQ